MGAVDEFEHPGRKTTKGGFRKGKSYSVGGGGGAEIAEITAVRENEPVRGDIVRCSIAFQIKRLRTICKHP